MCEVARFGWGFIFAVTIYEQRDIVSRLLRLKNVQIKNGSKINASLKKSDYSMYFQNVTNFG